ncbi:hypothetical protein V3C99_013422 [Haemonchus contortus]
MSSAPSRLCLVDCHDNHLSQRRKS